MKYLNNKIRLYRNKAGLLRGAYEHNVQRLWNTVPDLYRKIADIKVVLVVTQCVYLATSSTPRPRSNLTRPAADVFILHYATKSAGHSVQII